MVAEDCVESTTQVEHDFGLNLLQVNYCAEVLPGQDILDLIAREGGEDLPQEKEHSV